MKLKLKKPIKKGLIIISIYLIFTIYLFLAAERMNRLEKNETIENSGYSIKINK